MPPWCNKWLLGAIALSMGLHFLILEVDFLSVRFILYSRHSADQINYTNRLTDYRIYTPRTSANYHYISCLRVRLLSLRKLNTNSIKTNRISNAIIVQTEQILCIEQRICSV